MKLLEPTIASKVWAVSFVHLDMLGMWDLPATLRPCWANVEQRFGISMPLSSSGTQLSFSPRNWYRAA